jgi:hypothetical protein
LGSRTFDLEAQTGKLTPCDRAREVESIEACDDPKDLLHGVPNPGNIDRVAPDGLGWYASHGARDCGARQREGLAVDHELNRLRH